MGVTELPEEPWTEPPPGYWRRLRVQFMRGLILMGAAVAGYPPLPLEDDARPDKRERP
jgi:hypothetical protein